MSYIFSSVRWGQWPSIIMVKYIFDIKPHFAGSHKWEIAFLWWTTHCYYNEFRPWNTLSLGFGGAVHQEIHLVIRWHQPSCHPQPPLSHPASSAFGDTYILNFMTSHHCPCPVPCQGPCFLVPPHLPAIYSTAISTSHSSQIIILWSCVCATMETRCCHCGVAKLLNSQGAKVVLCSL